MLDPSDVLAVLSRHGLVSTALRDTYECSPPRFYRVANSRRRLSPSRSRASRELFDTCYSNLTTKDPQKHIGQLQRTVVAERFDMSRLPEYDAFLRESAEAFLVKNDAWLKRRELKHTTGRHSRIGYVGVGIFGFKAR